MRNKPCFLCGSAMHTNVCLLLTATDECELNNNKRPEHTSVREVVHKKMIAFNRCLWRHV